jgi:hypothetical protein
MKDLLIPMDEGQENKPLHIGEVTYFWLLLALLEEGF